MMKYFGQTVFEDGSRITTDRRAALLLGDPIARLRDMDAVTAQEFVADLAVEDMKIASSVPNYLLVSWENLRLAGWIGYYGNWDIVSGTSSPGNMQRVQGEVRIDSAAGSLMIKGQPVPLDTLVQMLIAPPENFADDFTLVVDRYPWVRAYKVKD